MHAMVRVGSVLPLCGSQIDFKSPSLVVSTFICGTVLSPNPSAF